MAETADLIENAVAGDSVALQQLLLSHYGRLRAHVATSLSQQVQAVVGPEDVLQQAFADATRDIRSCRAASAEQFFSWLKTITDHRMLDTVRSLKRKKRGGEFRRAGGGGRAAGSVADLVEVLSDHGLTPSKHVAQEEAKQAVEVALAALPDHYRQAIWLYYGEGQDVAGVAHVLGRTPGAVRGILDRARKRMHETLGTASKYLTTR